MRWKDGSDEIFTIFGEGAFTICTAMKHNLFMSLLAIENWNTLTNEVLKALVTKLHISNGFADKHPNFSVLVTFSRHCIPQNCDDPFGVMPKVCTHPSLIASPVPGTTAWPLLWNCRHNSDTSLWFSLDIFICFNLLDVIYENRKYFIDSGHHHTGFLSSLLLPTQQQKDR